MANDSGSLILFAINSAVRLGHEARTAYVDATRRRELTLPLPNFFGGRTVLDAAGFFRSDERGKRFADVSPEIRDLLTKQKNGTLQQEGGDLLKTLHIEYANLRRAERGESVWNDGALVDHLQLNALLTVRQWRRGADPNPSALKRMAGAIIEVGIDYAQASPDLVDASSSRGRTLKSFLDGLDAVDFVHTDISALPVRLFVAAIEATAKNEGLLSGDPKIQELVKEVSRDLSDALGTKIAEIEESGLDEIEKRDAYRNVEDWGALVFRTTLTSAGDLVVNNPQKYFGLGKAGQQALVSGVGGSLLSLVLDEDGRARHRVQSQRPGRAHRRSARGRCRASGDPRLDQQ